MKATEDKRRAEGASTSSPSRANASREAAFRRALAHSRRVRVLKLVLPALAVVVAGSFAAYSYVSVPGAALLDIATDAEGKLVMANPKLDGFTKDMLPYSMKAVRALQKIKDGGVVELEGIDATLPVGLNKFATIDARRGIYDRDKNTLNIPEPITVTTTDGKSATLQSAYLEIGKGALHTEDPVSISMDGVRLAADRMRVLENGKVVIFEDRVRMELAPGRFGKPQPQDGKGLDQNVQD